MTKETGYIALTRRDQVDVQDRTANSVDPLMKEEVSAGGSLEYMGEGVGVFACSESM